MLGASAAEIKPLLLSFLLAFLLCFVRICRKFAFLRLILPLAVILKRLFAELFVFNLYLAMVDLAFNVFVFEALESFVQNALHV